jgi:hypothetical protein
LEYSYLSQRLKIIFKCAAYKILVPNLPNWYQGSYPGDKAIGRENDHSPLSSAEVNNAWTCISIPPYIFMAWCCVKHRDIFTNFTFTSASTFSRFFLKFQHLVSYIVNTAASLIAVTLRCNTPTSLATYSEHQLVSIKPMAYFDVSVS